MPGQRGRLAPVRSSEQIFGGAKSCSAGLTGAKRRVSILGMAGLGRWAVTAAAVAIVPQNALAAPLTPTGRWVVDFDAAQCLASREYGVFQRCRPHAHEPRACIDTD